MSDYNDERHERFPQPVQRPPLPRPPTVDEHRQSLEMAAAAKRSIENRGHRRAAAINAVLMARAHANKDGENVSQAEADVIMAITELLDRVAGE